MKKNNNKTVKNKQNTYNNNSNSNNNSNNSDNKLTNQSNNQVINLTMGFFESLSNNKLLIGIIAIFVNVGSRYIPINITKNQEELLKNISTEILIFAIIILMSRDIPTAIILTILFSILTRYILNENSNLCILPEQYRYITQLIDTNNDGIITDEELERAKNILYKHNQRQQIHNKIFMLNNLQ